MTSCLNRFRPKVFWRLLLIKHRSRHLDERPVLPLNNSILLRCVHILELAGNPFFVKKGVHICVLELRSVVAANLLDLHFKLVLGLPSEVFEDLLDLRFIIKKEHPRKS